MEVVNSSSGSETEGGNDGILIEFEKGDIVQLVNMRDTKYNNHLVTIIDNKSSLTSHKYSVFLHSSRRVLRRKKYNLQYHSTDYYISNLIRDRIQIGEENVEQFQLSLSCEPFSVMYSTLLDIGFPSDIVLKILGCLEILQFDMNEVTAVLCSSQANPSPFYSFSMHNTLERNTFDCWISQPRSDFGMDFMEVDENQSEHHPEWIMYRMVSESNARLQKKVAIHSVTICIPPLPHGPLSVRKFYLEVVDYNSATEISTNIRSNEFTTLDSMHEQSFAISPPLEATYLKVVFTQNARNRPEDPVGFW
eukprot:CAMPEP_0182442100 /NCGR_PEP_ID=MMETSP1172-20130603/1065_1 /TAXON_ID=708627 /ORGANISM="Timspurckia oligopyrenoides, Strain CCMP3278" /LENGTH=305 /DNA_ID=CAMNT_0024636799 /DNA_START=63 /DNA_END=977 /DNA_ORIENTATION=+